MPSSSLSAMSFSGEESTCRVAETFQLSEGPDNEVLRNATFIDLSRGPGSSTALAFVDAAADLTRPFLDRQRPLGPRGIITFKAELGAILGGLLRAWFKGRAVSAQRRPDGFMWTGALIGNRAFWGKVDALREARLVGERKGLTTNEWSTDDPLFRGLPTRLWPTAQLLTLADRYGLSSVTVLEDWPISRAAETRRVRLPRSEMVICRPMDGAGKAKLPVADRKTMTLMAKRVETVNAAIGAADIRGCPSVALRRMFRHDLRLGGRLYAVGGGESYQRMSATERNAIRIDGEAVAEIDVSASALTVLLGLCGADAMASGDLYDLGAKIPRNAVKAWLTQSLGSGRPATRWSEARAPEIRAIKARSIRDAVFDTYPELNRSWQSILPSDLAASVPAEKLGWAVGQYITFIESEIIEEAVVALARDGVAALPVYDSLIVRDSETDRAEATLAAAFHDHVGLTPRLHR